MNDESSQQYITDEEDASGLLALTENSTQNFIVVCPEGHVHIVVGAFEVTLSPSDAKQWVETLYDAAEEAEQGGK